MLPALTHWENTRDGLHRAAQVLSAVKQTHLAPQPNWLHVALFVYENGLTTGRLDNGSEIMLDFTSASVQYVFADGATSDRVFDRETGRWQAEGGASGVESGAIPLNDHTSQSLLNTLAAALRIEATGAMIAALDFQAEQAIQVDTHLSAEYAHALYAIYSGLSRFRARLFGTMTPYVVWAHGFDLSMLWFYGHDPDESAQPHINVGFSPGSSGFDRPYIYAYAYPMPDGFQTRSLPAPAHWYNDLWQGAVVDYDSLTADKHPEQRIEYLARGMFDALR